MEELLSPSDETAGSFLRRKREEKGISLDEASQVTRIGKNYLADIEGNRFEKLPNPAYVKGFLRSYASFLGIPAEEVIRLYDRAHEQEQAIEPPPAAVEKRKPQPVAYLVVGAVVVLAALGYMIGQREEQASGPPPVHKEIVPAPLPPVQPPVSSAKKPGAEAVTTPYEPPAVSVDGAAKGVFLRLKVNEDTKIFMNIDGSVTQEYALNAGDLIEWKGENFFIIDVDDPAGVEAELNGRKLPPLGPPGVPAHVVLRRDGAGPATQEQGEN